MMIDPRAGHDLLPGTLDMLILTTLAESPRHGYAIAQHIREISRDVLQVEQGSLYPALHRMQRKGWISGKWERSDTNRRVKLYRMTREGRRHMDREAMNWRTMTEAVGRVMEGVS